VQATKNYLTSWNLYN